MGDSHKKRGKYRTISLSLLSGGGKCVQTGEVSRMREKYETKSPGNIKRYLLNLRSQRSKHKPEVAKLKRDQRIYLEFNTTKDTLIGKLAEGSDWGLIREKGREKHSKELKRGGRRVDATQSVGRSTIVGNTGVLQSRWRKGSRWNCTKRGKGYLRKRESESQG